MPERGRLTEVGVWTAGVGQTATAYLAVWLASTGALLAQSDALTIASRPGASGNVDLYLEPLIDPPTLEAGTQFLAGFWRDKARSHQLTSRGSGAHRDKKAAASDADFSGAHTGGHGFGDYAVGCHAYYEKIAGAWVRRSGAWTRAESVSVRRAGAWSPVTAVQTRRSGVWNDAD